MRLLRKIIPCSLCILCLLALAITLTGCDSPPPAKPAGNKPSSGDLITDPLRIGDRIKVELLGTADPYQPIEQEVKNDGTINLPLIGSVQAANVSPSQLEKDIEAKYKPAWYPHINVTVVPTARFIYVMGQVVGGGTGGRILCTGSMTVLQAIAAAGDFTPFANRRSVQVTRADGVTVEHENCVKALGTPKLDLRVYPGDTIYVGRRGIY
jgi:protein involved in polysaccharide export with SLBB domain